MTPQGRAWRSLDRSPEIASGAPGGTGGADALPSAALPGVVLLERGDELSAVTGVVADVARSSSATVVVEGPAGIGKSGILAALRSDAEAAGFRVLAARGSELERAFPFGVVRQLLEPLLRAGGEQRLHGSAAAAAPVFGAPTASTDDASFAVLHGLYWLTLELVSEQPLALVVDDLHWVDVPSLRFFSYLASRVEGEPLLLAFGLREGHPGVDGPLVADLVAAPGALRLRPAPLSATAVADLVRQRLGEDPAPLFVAACHESTGGNPLLLHELLRTVAAEGVRPSAGEAGSVRSLGSRAIARTVLVRLARLSPAALAVARAVAVLGEGTDLRAVGALAEIEEEDAAVATRELAVAEILRSELPLGFVHPLVRDAVYDDLAAGEREVLHARAVVALETLGAPTEQLAAHWLILQPRHDPAVARTLRTAARAAQGQGAPETAVAYLRRALEEPLADDERASVLLELGSAAGELQLPEAAGWLREAREALADPAGRARAGELLARQLAVAARGPEAVEVARVALAEVPEGMRAQRRRLAAAELLGIAFGGDATGVRERVAELRADIDEWDESAWTLEAQLVVRSALFGRPAAECVARARAVVRDGSIVSTDAMGAFGAIIVLVLGEEREALDLLGEVSRVAHRRGSLFSVVGLHVWQGWSLLAFGEVDEAAAALGQVEERDAAWARAGAAASPLIATTRARTLLEQGDVDGARAVLDRSADATPGSDGAMFAAVAEAEVLVAEGRPAEALARVDRERAEFWRADNPSWLPWRPAAARALAALDRVDDAIALADEELERALGWGTPGAVGRALRLRGELAGCDEARLREAVQLLAGSALRLEHAKALAALGRSVRLDRRPTEAREPLSQALEIAISCGATALARDVRSELYATGARPRRAARTGVGSLTPSELRVAHLAADGRTNREVAELLYVTPKTVEVHLSSAYRKLGIRSRAGLARALG